VIGDRDDVTATLVGSYSSSSSNRDTEPLLEHCTTITTANNNTTTTTTTTITTTTRLHYYRIHPCDQKKTSSFHPLVRSPSYFGFGSSSSFPQLWL